MTPSEAGVIEILRSAQKDDWFIDRLRKELGETTVSLLGPNFWTKYGKWANMLLRLSYYSLTTLSDNQTLGEEYTGIIQTDPSLKRVAPWTRRLLSMVLESTLPLVSGGVVSHLTKSNHPYQYLVKTLLTLLQQSHLSFFYLRGHFYSFFKRILQIRYILSMWWLQPKPLPLVLHFLGWCSVAQLLVYAAYHLPRSMKQIRLRAKNQNNISIDTRSTERGACTLCLEAMKHPAMLFCGHVFCWDCIQGYLKSSETPSCPLCRQSTSSNKLIPLINW